jgi:DNA-binding NtrC family response regulator
LRERKGDIIVLVDHFIKQFNEKLGKNIKGVSKKTLKLFYDYDWPGNVRELENLLERCVILSDGEYIEPDVLPPNINSSSGTISYSSVENLFTDESPVIPFEKLKEEAIKHALKVTNGNIVDASRKLKIGRATLYRLMEKYKIESPKS